MQKSDLKEFRILTTASMPSYKDKLGPQQLSDVVAYLASLRGPGRGAAGGRQGGPPPGAGAPQGGGRQGTPPPPPPLLDAEADTLDRGMHSLLEIIAKTAAPRRERARERATRTERAGEAARERACRGSPRGEAPRVPDYEKTLTTRAAVVIADSACHTGAGHLRPAPARGAGTSELVDLLRRLLQPSPQPADADRSEQRQAASDRVGVPGRLLAPEFRGHADRRRRRDVLHAADQRRRGGRRENRAGVLDLPPQPPCRHQAVLWIRESRRRRARRSGVLRDPRRTFNRARQADRARGLEKHGYAELRRRIFADDGAAHHQGQGGRRRRRRRVRHPRLGGGVRGDDREGSLAVQHRARTWRARPRRLAR